MSTYSTSSASSREAESGFGMPLDRCKGQNPTSDNVSDILYNSLKSRADSSLNKTEAGRQLLADRQGSGAPEGIILPSGEKSSKIFRVDSPSLILPASTVVRRSGREAAPPRVPLSNTAPPSSQNPYYRGSLDTLHLACHVQHARHFPKTFAKLEEIRQKALKERKRQEVRLFGLACNVVNAHPVMMGKALAQIMLECNGVTLLLSDCADYSKDQANLWLQIGSLPFLSQATYGFTVQHYAFKLVEAFGARCNRSSPQTLHYCIDANDIPMSLVAEAKQDRCFITRANKKSNHEGDDDELQTQYFGRRPNPQVRIYNKFEECRINWRKTGQQKWRLIVANRFDGVEPKTATRIEWELNRDVLRDKFDADDWQDCDQKMGTIMHYMTHEFLRFTEEPVDKANKNQSRAKTAQWWTRVQDSVAANLAGKNQPVEKHEAKPMTFEEKYHNAWGYIFGGMASEGFVTRDKGELLAYAEERLLATLPEDWEERLGTKFEKEEERRFVAQDLPHEFHDEDVEEFISGDGPTIIE